MGTCGHKFNLSEAGKPIGYTFLEEEDGKRYSSTYSIS